MDVRYSKQHGLVVVAMRGFIDAALITHELLPLMSKPELALLPLALLDLTRADGTSAPSDLIRVAARKASQQIDPGLEVRNAKLAIAAVRDEFFGLGRMYGLLRGGDKVEVNVFRSVADAERWLELPLDYAIDLEEIAV